MFRYQYDNDAATWTPQGRTLQVEYAMEAVKQGTPVVGLRSNDYAVLAAFKRVSGKLASHHKKIFKVDEHLGFGMSGLTSDARGLSNYMRTEAMRSRMLFNRSIPVNRLVSQIGDKAQVNTQIYGKRPFGVGLLVIGYDNTGSHLFDCSPSGTIFEYYATSIGSRSQSARTYLEKNFSAFENATSDQLIQHAIQALKGTLQQDKELTVENCSIAIVGKNRNFEIIENEALQPHFDRWMATDVTPMETE